MGNVLLAHKCFAYHGFVRQTVEIRLQHRHDEDNQKLIVKLRINGVETGREIDHKVLCAAGRHL
jgi:uncharacterized protein YfdQ (DUF2303 family)